MKNQQLGRHMPPAHPKNKHSGSIMIMVAIMLPIILGILSLAIDLGNVFLVRSQMQNTVDPSVKTIMHRV